MKENAEGERGKELFVLIGLGKETYLTEKAIFVNRSRLDELRINSDTIFQNTMLPIELDLQIACLASETRQLVNYHNYSNGWYHADQAN